VGQQQSEVADVGPTEKGTALVGHYPWPWLVEQVEGLVGKFPSTLYGKKCTTASSMTLNCSKFEFYRNFSDFGDNNG